MKTCAFIIISSVAILLCFQKGIFIIQKGHRIRINYNNLQENTGVTCEADGIPFYWGKKEPG